MWQITITNFSFGNNYSDLRERAKKKDVSTVRVCVQIDLSACARNYTLNDNTTIMMKRTAQISIVNVNDNYFQQNIIKKRILCKKPCAKYATQQQKQQTEIIRGFRKNGII